MCVWVCVYINIATVFMIYIYIYNPVKGFLKTLIHFPKEGLHSPSKEVSCIWDYIKFNSEALYLEIWAVWITTLIVISHRCTMIRIDITF